MKYSDMLCREPSKVPCSLEPETLQAPKPRTNPVPVQGSKLAAPGDQADPHRHSSLLGPAQVSFIPHGIALHRYTLALQK